MNVVKEKIELSAEFPFQAFNAVIASRKQEELYYHWHECIEMAFVREGEGIYFVNGKSHEMKPGDIILFNSGEPHCWNAVSSEPMIQPVIVFDPALIWCGQNNLFDYEYLNPLNGYCSNFTNKLPKEHPAGGKIYEILNLILQEYIDKPPAYHLMIKAKLLEIMSLLIRYFQVEGKLIEPLAVKKKKLLRLQEVTAFIDSNFTGNLRIEDAARIANMNTNYFSTFFKDIIGLTFTDYITKQRISKAVELISNTDDTFASIAFACGFNSMSNFYRAYKRFKGGHPSDVRKQILETLTRL